MKKLNFNDFFFKLKTKQNPWLYKFFSMYKITLFSAQRKGWSIYIVRGRECFAGLSILLVRVSMGRLYCTAKWGCESLQKARCWSGWVSGIPGPRPPGQTSNQSIKPYHFKGQCHEILNPFLFCINKISTSTWALAVYRYLMLKRYRNKQGVLTFPLPNSNTFNIWN